MRESPREAGRREKINLTAPSQVRALLDRYGLRPNRRLGQNFLIDANILGKIVAAADLQPDDAVLEIGPGLGTLTRELAGRAGRVVAVELDRLLLPVLQETLQGYDNVTLVHGDAVRMDWAALCPSEAVTAGRSDGNVSDGRRRWKVVANLPYYITGPVLARLLPSGLFSLVVVMVQMEVARRMSAVPGSREYGAFSVMVQYYAEPELVARVPPAAFFPPPDVCSAVVRLKIRTRPPVEADSRLFFTVVRAAFRHRRKSLRNALESGLPARAAGEAGFLLRKAGIDGSRRAETLSLAEFASLANALSEMAKDDDLLGPGAGRIGGDGFVE